VKKSDSDFAFFLYDLVPTDEEKRLELRLSRIIYTQFAVALEQIAKFVFTQSLQKRLDARRSPKSDLENLENIVAE
jgi:hypothetical protein